MFIGPPAKVSAIAFRCWPAFRLFWQINSFPSDCILILAA